MAKITRKNTAPSIGLLDILRKRRISFKKFILDFGINSYESLKLRCERMGVVPPVESKFNEAKGSEFVNSPTDGILVLEAPKVINEKTGEEINVELSSESEMIFSDVIDVTESKEDFEEISSSKVNDFHSQNSINKKNKKIKNKWNDDDSLKKYEIDVESQ